MGRAMSCPTLTMTEAHLVTRSLPLAVLTSLPSLRVTSSHCSRCYVGVVRIAAPMRSEPGAVATGSSA
jgi:hypothetical protein